MLGSFQVEEVTTKHGRPISVAYDVVAQLVEQFPFKERVESSSLSSITMAHSTSGEVTSLSN